MNENFSNTEIILADLLKLIFASIPDRAILYIDKTIDDLYNMGGLQEIINYIDPITGANDMEDLYLYDYAINLSYECKEYFISELTSDPYIVNYFEFFGIRVDNKWYLKVVDGSNIYLLNSISIPERMVSECAKNGCITLSFVNPVH